MKSSQSTAGSSPAKKQEPVIYISNLSEDVWPFIKAITNDAERQFEVESNANVADREVFTTSDETNVVIIAPKSIQPEFVEYFRELMGIRKVEVWTPQVHTGQTSVDIVHDTALFEKLVSLGKSSQKLTLTSYSTSYQFLALVQSLRERGITVYTPEAPDEDDAWTVNFFGSKSGFRQLSQQSVAEEPDFLMAEGMICDNIVDASKIAAQKYIKEEGVVIKTNKGHSGAGVLIFRKGELPAEYRACESAVLKVFQHDAYWSQFPIVIESLVNINTAVGGGFPNIEFKIRKSGEVEVLYFCGMRVTSDGVFQGIEIHEDVLNDRVEARVTDLGFFIGEELASNGYRGYYSIDLISAKNGDVFISEANTRRTGGTHVYKTALKLIGRNFMSESYIVSHNDFAIPNHIRPTFARVHEALAPLLFNKKTKEGVVIASANLLQQSKLSYIIFGHTRKRTIEIEEKMVKLLEKL